MANDNEPNNNVETNHIKISVKKAQAESVPVNIEFTKRRQLDAVLDLLDGFEPKEVKQIVKMYKRKRKTAKLQQQNAEQRAGILAGSKTKIAAA